MGVIGDAIKGEGMGFVWLFVNIFVLKATVFMAKSSGILLSRLARNSYIRYGLFLLLFGGLLWGSNYYHRQYYPKNLFRKHGITRHSPEKLIKDMYRKFARENHPDVLRSAGKSKKDFASTNFEFKVLTHKAMRLQYDKFGEVNNEVNIYSNMGFKVTSVVSSFLFYLGQGIFIIAFTSEDQSVRIKSGCFYLTITLLLYELFTIFARTDSMKDPLDFVYTDMTLRERLDYIQTTFLGYLFMFVFYKYAFSLSFSTRFQLSSGYVMIGIKAIESVFAKRKADFILQNQKTAESSLQQDRPVVEKDQAPPAEPKPVSNTQENSVPADTTEPPQSSAPKFTVVPQPDPQVLKDLGFIEDPIDENLQITFKEHFRCIAEYILAIAKVQREPVEANKDRKHAHKGLNQKRKLIDVKKYGVSKPKKPPTEGGAPPAEAPGPSDAQPDVEEPVEETEEQAEEPKKSGGILSMFWDLAKALVWLMGINTVIRYLLR